MTENRDTRDNTESTQTGGNAKALELRPHPRLYFTPEMLQRVKQEPRLSYLRSAAERVRESAERHVDAPPVEYPVDRHNSLLLRARQCQTIVFDLLIQYKRTADRRFRDATVGYVRQMGEWEYWSWKLQRRGDTRPDGEFDLSYGENSATLAMAYDILHDELSADEKETFLDVARSRPFPSAIKHCKEGKAWWFGCEGSNWNTVCAGGLGMLCLAMYEDVPEAPELLARVERSVEPYMRHLDANDGGWPEGLSYWNFGMRYAFLYLLSHENATGNPHSLMLLDGVRATMRFPIDTAPNGVEAGFGDLNRWLPLAFYWETAARMGDDTALSALHARLESKGIEQHDWPNDAEFLAVHAGDAPTAPTVDSTGPVLKFYENIAWGILADRLPNPNLYMSIRGGTTQVHHSHRDLLSFHCIVQDEAMIRDLDNPPYLDTSFSPRREELLEIAPVMHNGLFLNGVGIASKSSLDATETVEAPGVLGFRLVATTAMGSIMDGPAAAFCGRLALMLEGRAFLLIDAATLHQLGYLESRMHSLQNVEMRESGALIQAERASLRVAYASTVPAQAALHGSLPTLVSGEPAKVLRWGTPRRHPRIALATLLSPGDGDAQVALRKEGEALIATAKIGDWTREIRIEEGLRLAE